VDVVDPKQRHKDSMSRILLIYGMRRAKSKPMFWYIDSY